MPIEYSPRSQCIDKVPYYTRADAKAAVKRDERHLGVRLRQYACPHCGHRHIGNRVAPQHRKTA